jgi:flagellar hook-basal body complex protein FliE
MATICWLRAKVRSGSLLLILWVQILLTPLLSLGIVKQKKAEEGPSTTQPKQIHRTPPAKEDLTTKLKDINDDLIKTVKQKDIFTEGQKDELEDAIDALFQSKNKTTPYATKKFGLNLDDETAHEIENHLNRPRISFEADEDVLVEHINIQLAKAPPESRFTFRPSSCVSRLSFLGSFLSILLPDEN